MIGGCIEVGRRMGEDLLVSDYLRDTLSAWSSRRRVGLKYMY